MLTLIIQCYNRNTFCSSTLCCDENTLYPIVLPPFDRHGNIFWTVQYVITKDKNAENDNLTASVSRLYSPLVMSNQNEYKHWSCAIWYSLHTIWNNKANNAFGISCYTRKKGRDLTQSCDKKPPTPTEQSKKQRDNIKTPPKTLITQLLRTDLGRSVGVTAVTQLVWLNRFTSAQPSH